MGKVVRKISTKIYQTAILKKKQYFHKVQKKRLTIRFLFVCLLLTYLFSINASAQNLISNPGFEDGIAGWENNKNNGATANYTIDTLNSPEGTNHFKAEVISLGTNDWDLQIRSNDFAVNKSDNYRLTFWAKSENAGANVKIYVQKSSWMGKQFTLSDSWTKYTYEFFPNESTKQLKFNFVEVTNYYIDDIVLEKITTVNSDFNTPPSCVITAPHVNSYFKSGSEITINAHATDKGGSGIDGEVSKVEFYVGNEKIGESSTSKNNTYTYVWNAWNTGEYRIKAVATDTLGKSFTSAGVLVSVGSNSEEPIGLSSGKGKYLGNNVRNSGVEPAFTEYWNAVTSGNGGKWRTVEKNRNTMKWDLADEAYNFAKNNHLPYRYHTLAWGSQYPDWITTLEPAAFQAEMEQFIKAIADRYPYIDQIDVINEPLPGHQEETSYFIDGLGGAGESGYDWAVWLFKKAREYFPNSKLILNDFGMVNSSSNIRKQLLLLKVLRDSALVDGFGAQAHTFNLDNMQPDGLKQNLDLMATAGVPLYMTELDMQGKNIDEASQLDSYQTLFPVIWEHPDVAGITLWGYIYENMWKPYAGLVYENGEERSCMVWLKEYMNEQEDLGYPFANHTISSEPIIHDTNDLIKVYPNPAKDNLTVSLPDVTTDTRLSIYNIHGKNVREYKLSKRQGILSIDVSSLKKGVYLISINVNKRYVTKFVKN